MGRRPQDPETIGINRLLNILIPFDLDARARMLAYTKERLARIPPSGTPHANSEDHDELPLVRFGNEHKEPEDPEHEH